MCFCTRTYISVLEFIILYRNRICTGIYIVVLKNIFVYWNIYCCTEMYFFSYWNTYCCTGIDLLYWNLYFCIALVGHRKDESTRKLALQQDDSIHITNQTVENCANSICISRQLVRRRPTEQVAEHCQLQTATKSQVGRRHMRTMLNSILICIAFIE